MTMLHLHAVAGRAVVHCPHAYSPPWYEHGNDIGASLVVLGGTAGYRPRALLFLPIPV